jgi:hypothetical protein
VEEEGKRKGKGRGEESNCVEEEPLNSEPRGHPSSVEEKWTGRQWKRKRTTLFARRRWKRKRRVRTTLFALQWGRGRGMDWDCRPLAALQWGRGRGMDWDCRPTPRRKLKRWTWTRTGCSAVI